MTQTITEAAATALQVKTRWEYDLHPDMSEAHQNCKHKSNNKCIYHFAKYRWIFSFERWLHTFVWVLSIM